MANNITRPANFKLSFKAGINIGDMWWGGGIWESPLNLPITPNMPDGGKWNRIPTVLDLTGYAYDAGYDDTQYGYNFASVLEWGEYSGGGSAEDWENTKTKIDERTAWIWGNVISGLGLVRVSSDSWYFLATYGLYSDGSREKIVATASQQISSRDLREGAFTWFTSVTSNNPYSGSTWGDGMGYAVCWTHGNNGSASIDKHDYFGIYLDVVVPYIEYTTAQGVTLNDTFNDDWIVTIVGGKLPAMVTTMNSIASPFAGLTGPCYYPDRYAGDGWELIAGGPFIEAQDSSADSAETPATSAGGDGNYDNTSDPIDFPDSDQFATDALNSGFITVFNPTKNQILDFASFLYSNSITDAIANQLKRLLADPMDYIIGLNMAHFKPTTDGQSTINFGGVSTGVEAEVVAPQMQFIDCGEVSVPVQTDSFQDYEMSKISIYLPYCGIHSLDVQECMDSKIWVQYVIDTITGSCVANVKITRNRDYVTDDPDLEAILYSFTGNCFITIPLTSRDFKTTISGLLGVAGGVGSIASGGIGGVIGGVSGIANSIMSSTPNASRVGNYSSNYGYMQTQKPYLILERPMASTPTSYEGFYGRPLYNNMLLSECWGYTEVDTDRFWATGEGFNGITDEEKEMLLTELNSTGIYIDHGNDYANYNPRS